MASLSSLRPVSIASIGLERAPSRRSVADCMQSYGPNRQQQRSHIRQPVHCNFSNRNSNAAAHLYAACPSLPLSLVNRASGAALHGIKQRPLDGFRRRNFEKARPRRLRSNNVPVCSLGDCVDIMATVAHKVRESAPLILFTVSSILECRESLGICHGVTETCVAQQPMRLLSLPTRKGMIDKFCIWNSLASTNIAAFTLLDVIQVMTNFGFSVLVCGKQVRVVKDSH
jgi:hypothetical protein